MVSDSAQNSTPLVCGDKPQLSASSGTYGKGAGLSERPLKKKGQSPGSPPDPPGVGGQRSGITACHQPRSWLPAALPGRKESNAGRDGSRTTGEKTSDQAPPTQPSARGGHPAVHPTKVSQEVILHLGKVFCKQSQCPDFPIKKTTVGLTREFRVLASFLSLKT